LLRTALQLKRIIYFCTAAAFLLVPAGSFGADETPLPWEITADRITHEDQPEKIIAEGNVSLRQYKENLPTGFVIQADRILYNLDENLVHGSGNLHLIEKDNEVRASGGQINLADQVGVFNDASIFWRENNLFVTADQIEKTDESTYHFHNGKFTTCPVTNDKKPDWSIWSKNVNVSLEEYASLKHATFRVKDVPVFYLPYLRFPIGSSKKTGFLFPEYSTSQRNGTGLIAPFFINLSPSYDITLYPGYYEDRGVVTAGEFRYAAGPNSRGTFLFNYLDDDLVDTPADEFKSDGILRTNSDRYWFRGKADHDFGDRLVAKLDIDTVSDRDYLQEFKKGIIGFDQSNTDFLKVYKRGFQTETIDHRENTLQISKIWATTDLQAEISIIDDVRDDPVEDTPPWALPRIAYSGLLPILQTPLDLVWGTEYVYFWRDEGIGAHRIDLHPQLNGPLTTTPYFESSYQVGVRETLYFLEPHDTTSELLYPDDFEDRTLYDILLTGATTLSKDYSLNSEKYKSFRHAIRPELSYLLVQGSGQGDLPVLDDEDRVTEKNWLQYSLNNYFRVIRLDEISLFKSSYSTFKIEQVYDTEADDHPFSDIYLEFIFRGIQDLFFRYETTVSMYGKGVTTYSLESMYSNERGDRLNLDYRYKKNPEISRPYFFTDTAGESLTELRVNLESRLSDLFSVKFDHIYSFSTDNTVNSTFSIAYHNPCWTLEFAANRTSDDTGFYLLFSLVGISTPLDIGLPEF
jgi:LPS-assembly protein